MKGFHKSCESWAKLKDLCLDGSKALPCEHANGGTDTGRSGKVWLVVRVCACVHMCVCAHLCVRVSPSSIHLMGVSESSCLGWGSPHAIKPESSVLLTPAGGGQYVATPGSWSLTCGSWATLHVLIKPTFLLHALPPWPFLPPRIFSPVSL